MNGLKEASVRSLRHRTSMAQGNYRSVYDVPPLPPILGALLFSITVLLVVAILATILL